MAPVFTTLSRLLSSGSIVGGPLATPKHRVTVQGSSELLVDMSDAAPRRKLYILPATLR